MPSACLECRCISAREALLRMEALLARAKEASAEARKV